MSENAPQQEKRAKLIIFVLVIIFAGVYLKLNFSNLTEAMKLGEIDFGVDDQFSSLGEFFKASADHADDDADGLDNALEAFLGSDKSLQDSDGDGFTDYDEFVSGYDLLSESTDIIDENRLKTLQESFLQNYKYSAGNILQHYYARRALGLYKEEENDLAFQLFNKAVETEKSQDLFDEVLDELFEEENFEAASVVAQFYTGVYSESPAAYAVNGRAKQELELYKEAIFEYQLAVKKGSKNPEVYQGIADSQEALQNQGEEIIEEGDEQLEGTTP